MKLFLFIQFLTITSWLYAGPIREGIVREIEKKLLYVPREIMPDKSKSMFLTNLYLEISDNDELVILQTYMDLANLLGMKDPLGLLSYINEKDAQASEKMNQQLLQPDKKDEKPQSNIPPEKNNTAGDIRKHLDSIKEAREYREQLLNEDK